MLYNICVLCVVINHITDRLFWKTIVKAVDKEKGILTDEVEYMTADTEDEYIIAQASEPVDEKGRFVNDRIRVRYLNEITEVEKDKVD